MGCGSSRAAVSPWPAVNQNRRQSRKRFAWQNSPTSPKQARISPPSVEFLDPKARPDSNTHESEIKNDFERLKVQSDEKPTLSVVSSSDGNDDADVGVPVVSPVDRPFRLSRLSSTMSESPSFSFPSLESSYRRSLSASELSNLPVGLGRSRSIRSIRSYHHRKSEQESPTAAATGLPHPGQTVSRAVLKECVAISLACADLKTSPDQILDRNLPPPVGKRLSGRHSVFKESPLLSDGLSKSPGIGVASRASVISMSSAASSVAGKVELEDLVDRVLTDVHGASKKMSSGSAVSMLVMRPSLVVFPGTITEVDTTEIEKIKKGELERSEIGLSEELVTPFELYNHMNAGVIHSYLSDPFYLLILDVRSDDLYQKSHISTARWHKDVTMDMRFLIDPSSYLDQYSLVVIYDNGDDKGLGMQLLKEFETLGIERVSFLLGGFKSFRHQFSYLCDAKSYWSDKDRQDIEAYPSAVIAHKLFQGNCQHASSERVFHDLGITHVVNVTSEHRNSFDESVTYLKISVLDERESNLFPYLNKTTDFLMNALQTGGIAFVHCTRGVSRSSTVTIAFLMKRYSWTLGTAFEFLKDRRPGIRPNRGFLEQLSKWEEAIQGVATTDIDELW
eukprot:m.310615 g.310615  ORF g.310615 m.310615 type:complete len:620 (+) comp53162_c0_seq1:182-2041(+)